LGECEFSGIYVERELHLQAMSFQKNNSIVSSLTHSLLTSHLSSNAISSYEASSYNLAVIPHSIWDSMCGLRYPVVWNTVCFLGDSGTRLCPSSHAGRYDNQWSN